MISNSFNENENGYNELNTNNINKKNKLDKFDKNDLFKACENNEIIKVSNLLHYGIDINSKTDSGNTALYITTKLKNKLLVEYLIEQGADINHQNNKGMTPLHIAALYGYVDIVMLLVKNNANTNIECNKNVPTESQVKLYRQKRESNIYCISGFQITNTNRNSNETEISSVYYKKKLK